MSIFDSFERKHDYLVCVDSDGCVMDTMNCKHFHCFGPCMVAEWGLEEWQDEILARWNVINLFSMTRGINRFKGLFCFYSLRILSCLDVPFLSVGVGGTAKPNLKYF